MTSLVKVEIVGLLISVAGLMAAPSDATAESLYDVKTTWGPTILMAGAPAEFTLQLRNIGDTSAGEKLTVIDNLPTGVVAKKVDWRDALNTVNYTNFCKIEIAGTRVSCVIPSAEAPKVVPAPSLEASGATISPQPTGYALPISIEAEVDSGASGAATNETLLFRSSTLEATDSDQVTFGAVPAPFGIVPSSLVADVFTGVYPSDEVSRQAGDHPFEERVKLDLTSELVESSFDGTLETPSNGSLRNVEVTLPRGLIGNPQALPKCDPLKFAQDGATNNSTRCPPETQVGYLNATGLLGGGNHGNGLQPLMPGANALLSRIPLYNLVPRKGTPVDIGFKAQIFVIGHIYATLDPAHEYKIKVTVPNSSSIINVRGFESTIWGVPGDPGHNDFRYFAIDQKENPEKLALGAPFNAPVFPFFTDPMDCGTPNGAHRVGVDSYQDPSSGEIAETQEYASPLEVKGCDDPRFRFEPDIALQPTDRHAGAPTGLAVHLKVPQRDEEAVKAGELYAKNGFVRGVSTPPLKKAVVTLPEGMTLNPSATQGLASCSPQQIGLGTNSPVNCPDASQYGTLTLHTPALPPDQQPEGFIYVAQQEPNPFHLTLYLVIEQEETGIRVKLPGRVDLDPNTGQLTTTFDDLPQFPVSDVQMSFKSGVRAGLVEPSTCGEKTIAAELFSWHEPAVAHVVKSSYEITEKPDGSPCVRSLGERPFHPQMEAGAADTTAGEYEPFLFRLTRGDDDQEFSQVGVSLPPGLSARFAGVATCSDAQIVQAEQRTAAGDGALEQASPSCPASSSLGTTEVGTGVGVTLTYIPGKVYLAGPYEGAPLSMVAITPVVAGPFDLGVNVVRIGVNVDPATAQARTVSDPFPQILQGIPVRIRDIRLKLDRPRFTLNPTSCEPKKIDAHVTGAGGNPGTTADDTAVDLSERFQATDCGNLAFRPKLSFRLKGSTKQAAFPALQATVTYPRRGAYANIAAASVALPRSEFLAQEHIRTVCTRVQFAAKQCPAGSVYGHAVAKSPLFDFPLEGPVYLGTGYGHELPDLVAALKGPPSMPVEIVLNGRIDSVDGGRIRNTFEAVPDAPVEWFKLSMQGAKKGLLVNSEGICSKRFRATAKLTAQNGKRLTEHPLLKANCAKGRRRKR
jgi:hypothetical protein